MAPFFTRKGDEGYTSLFGKGKYLKSGARFEILGTLDETSAALGLARSFCQFENNRLIILSIQKQLSALMGELATKEVNENRFAITQEQVNWVEDRIKELENEVKYPGSFVFSGNHPAEAALDLARAVVRRAERQCVSFRRREQLANSEILRYLNRLSSLCYVLELSENRENSEEGMDNLSPDHQGH